MREIEAQTSRLHNAAGLLDMGSENLSKRRMQKMRPGVIAHRRMPRMLVDASNHRIADLQSLRLLDAVKRPSGRSRIRTLDDGERFSRLRRDQHACVSDLTAG